MEKDLANSFLRLRNFIYICVVKVFRMLAA